MPDDPLTARPVSVLVVDDIDDIREVVRLVLELDDRYEVVGEATDGIEGIAAAEALQPDVVILDRSMPRMDGIEALPRIRAVAPNAVVILYTAESDAQLHQAAVAAGAVGVMTKDASVPRLGELLADALIRSASDGGTDIAVHVGPVDSEAALAWIANTADILHTVRAAPDATDMRIDDEVFEIFGRYLELWREVAEANPRFTWAARASVDDVERLIEAWASIDRIDDEQLRRLGCEWSSPLGRSFFDALTSAVLAALTAHGATAALAKRLQPQWTPPSG